MARDRKRAKQRRAARERTGARPSQPVRQNVPGALDHASADVDQAEAAIVAGADGVEAPLDEIVAEPLLESAPDEEPLEPEEFDDELSEDEEELLDAEPAGDGEGGGPRQPTAVATRGDRPPAEERREGNPVINFLRASWAELQRVQWPDRRQVAQATAVVLGFVALAGGYLGVADAVFSRLVDAII